MKKKLLAWGIVIILLLSLLLCGCQPVKLPLSVESEEEGTIGNTEYLLQVLLSNDEFYNADDGKTYTLKNFNYWNGSYTEHPLSVTQYSFLDIDNDSNEEMVLELTNGVDGSICVMRYCEGTTSAYSFPYRGLKNLKSDGTFDFSSGAADSGCGMLIFSDNSYSTKALAYSESNYAGDEMIVHYYIADEAVNEVAFMDYCDLQHDMQNAVWFPYDEPTSEGLTFFQYTSGHSWSGFDCYTVNATDMGAVLTHQWIPSGMNEADPIEVVRIELEKNESDILSDIIIKEMKLTEWAGFYHPKQEATDQSGWDTCLLYDGVWYYSSGYEFYPKELSLFTKQADTCLGDLR